MKKLVFAVVFLLSTKAVAAPFYDTNPVPPGVSQCVWTVDGQAKPTTTTSTVAGTTICRLDLVGTTAGQHDIQVAGATANDPIWGSAVGPQLPAPFTFTKPAAPAALTSKGLSP